MQHPKEIGDRTTLRVMVALQELGYEIYVPWGENTRTDLIVARNGKISRLQCKTGRLRQGAVVFRPCSTYGHHPNPKITRRSYQGEIDEFAVYCPELGRVYLIPIEDVDATAQASLRLTLPRNNQAKKIRLAGAYEIARIDVY